jgi:hypothetical protein
MTQTMQIEVINVSPPTDEKSARGMTYQKCEVTYKNLTFQSKVEAKILVSFSNPQLFDTLSKSQFKDVFTIVRQKNEKTNYWDWIGLEDSANITTNNSQTGETNLSPANKTPRSTYETPEERAERQRFIIRQSSLSNAIAMYQHKSFEKVSLEPELILSVAKQFEDYVYGNITASENSFAEMPNDPL